MSEVEPVGSPLGSPLAGPLSNPSSSSLSHPSAAPLGSPRKRAEAAVGIGQIVCDFASSEPAASAAPPGQQLAAAPGQQLAAVPGQQLAAPPAQHLEVVIPVSVHLPHPQRGSDLVVRAEVRAPFGRPGAVVFLATPSAVYAEASTSTSVHAGVDFAPVSGGVSRTTSRQKLVCDVTGVGTACVEWSVLGTERQLAGTYEFRFLVRQQDAVFGWLDVAAELHAARGFPGLPAKPVSAVACTPLIADSSPQAAMTLVLHDELDARQPRVFVGRPLDLPLFHTTGGLAVGRAAPGMVAVGSIRWFDDIDGRPGYQWVQRSAELASLSGVPGQEIPQGHTAILENGSTLHLPSGRLRISYDGAYSAGAATVKDALDVHILVDEQLKASYTTASDYVTIGRARKDISIDRPDVSREHGSLELTGAAWTYTHHSKTHDAALLRPGDPARAIHSGSSVVVGHGDTVRLNDHVSLTID